MTYECTVCGGVATIWTGSLFNCRGKRDRITLRHTQFENCSASGGCNQETVTAHSHCVDLDTHCFTSQLFLSNLTISYTNNETVTCLNFFNKTHESVVNEASISVTRGKLIFIV